MRPVICSLLMLMSSFCNADAESLGDEQFNTDFINGKFDDTSVTRALNNGLNEKAIYSVSINGKIIGDIYFTRQNASLTFDEQFYTDALVPRLRTERLNELHQTMSLDLTSRNYTVEEKPDASTLSVWFHDVDMREDDGNDMPLTDSVNSVLLDYSMSPNYFMNRDENTSETSLPLNGHLRVGLYGFPVNVDFSSTDVIREGLDVDNLSVSHLLPPIKSEITAGQTYASSRYADGYHFYGVQISSVDDLFSRRERYYTPNITGYARTNATVEVYQGERLLYTKTVAAGQFVINEVQGLSNQTLRVVVKESDGTQSTFMYENTVVPGLLTPGSYSYEVNGGKYRYGDNDAGDAFASAEFSYGFDGLTLTANSVLSGSYRNVTLGSSFPLRTFGALGVAASSSHYQQNGAFRPELQH
ncbi:TPA: fimbrial biogenesis outer membrane usher protein [Enterobacter hormaechei subsp. steigerwaltii]|nr:fimbrial biogenesis outer membrane usher protein [Enterobacter hormaechei subsp. steigerwaltii]